MERGSPTLISTSPIAAVVNTLYKAGHGEVRTKAYVEQQRGSSLHPLLSLRVGCLAKVYWYFSCRFLRFFFPSHLFIFALLVLLPIRRNSDPESHGRLYSPLPTTVRALLFYRAKNSALSSLVDSRRVVPTHALVGALDSWCLWRMKNSTRRTHDINTSRA